MTLFLAIAVGLAYSPTSTWAPQRIASHSAARSASAVVALASTLQRPSAPDVAAPQMPQPETTAIMCRFTDLFCGHFDNIAQVEADLQAGLAPREGGGHEHIHCHLQQLPMRTRRFAEAPTEYVLASYYFNGQPEKVFRERVYALQPLDSDGQFGRSIQMRIFRLRPETEAALRDASGDASRVAWNAAEDAAVALRIPDCDVYWRWLGERFEGHMRTESIVVRSPVLQRDIVVKDDVALWEGGAGGEDALWCNDRGADMDGNYVYGNIFDVPYKMQRVSDEHWTVKGEGSEA